MTNQPKEPELTPYQAETKKQIALMWSKVGDQIGYLAMRWDDEREYEDFEDYRNAVIDRLTPYGAEHITVKSAGRFQVDFVLRGTRLQIIANYRSGRVKFTRFGHYGLEPVVHTEGITK